MKRHFPDTLKLYWGEVGGKLVSGLMDFAIGKRIQIISIVSDESYWDLRVNDVVHWEFIKWGCENGYEEFDFGSVRYDGQLRYKRKWGTEINDCGYSYVTVLGVNSRSFSSSSRSMGVFSKVWSVMIPCFLTGVLGPPIRRQLVR